MPFVHSQHLRGALACLAALALAGPAAAQLTDLQPGRNFTGGFAFGTGHSDNVDAADIDNDGDRDVVVAKGGDIGPRANEIFVNAGGAQAGLPGTFTDETATRFAGLPADTSRDLEFVDLEDDGDYDIFVANRGNFGNGGETGRAYVNLGGRQGGTIGFFSEVTDAFWGTLVSVPGSAEVGTVDGQGPWRDFSCDCDFADVDDDGDLDLFHSSYGPNTNGTHDSRVFLNDGAGRFDELWPWVEAGGDIQLHTLDVDLADLDGDFDMDILATSRDSQSRVYRNNLGDAGATALFTDVTQSALLDQGAATTTLATYEAELGDLDGDGDLDAWIINYDANLLDATLLNDGAGNFFPADLVRDDPDVDENEVDFLDFDSDGDLDVLATNFAGVSALYTNGLAQGLDPVDGLFMRNGGTVASWPELPTLGGGTKTDGDALDMDLDGDPDVMVTVTFGGSNMYWENELGVPDTFAPTFFQVTDQADKTDGSDTVIHAQVRDNAAWYAIGQYHVNLRYDVDSGTNACVRMVHQGGQQFRGVIPGGLMGQVAYRVEAVDDNGNIGVSSVFTYQQSGGSADLVKSISCGTPGVMGVPVLEGGGALTPGSPTLYSLRRAAPGAFAILFVSLQSTPIPFKGGTLHPVPVDVYLNRGTDTGGLDSLAFPWPAGLPAGTEVFLQYGVQDGTVVPYGAALSNAIQHVTP